MYIQENKNEKSENTERKKNEFLSSLKQPKRQDNKNLNNTSQKKLESPHDMFLSKHFEKADLHWRSLEFEMFERDKKWYVLVLTILILIIVYAIFTDSLIMAVTFILIGVVGYMYINKEPRELDFAIMKEGMIVGKELFSFDNLKSFWIFDDPDDVRVISIKTNIYLNPYLHIPLGDQKPEKIREVLSAYIPEEKHAPGFLEALDRFLKL